MRQIKKGEPVGVGGGPLERVPVRMPDGTLRELHGSLSGTVTEAVLARYRGQVCMKLADGTTRCASARRIIRPGRIQRVETVLPPSVEDETVPEGTVVEVLPSATIVTLG